MANRNKKRRMKKKSRSSTRLGMESLEEKRLMTTCVDMEDLTLGQTYNVGDSFVADNTGFQANVRARPFTWSNGNTTAGGFARVENSNLAGHLGQDMQVNNILLDMTFNDPVNDGLTMNFGEYGGNLNLGLNGTFTNFENFNDLDGANIGGTQISVVNGFGNDQGTITFDGPINSFAIGGQELWIDHLCLNRPQEGNFDWGDAPDGPNGPFYNTLATNGGAFHVIDDNVFLGQKIDPEADGQPNFAASGDDNNGAVPDDEDGVRFLTPIVPGQDAEVEVTANEDGFLSAWMDFGRNGQWDAGDQIFTVEFLSPGSHILSFPVPATAEPGTTYSRWRFTNEELFIGPKGTGNSFNEPMIGEVEDYRNEIEEDRQDDPGCIDFEDLALGSTYFVGDLFTADNTGFMADFRGEPFTFSSGGTTASGFAEVENGGMAGHLGQDLQVNNILLNANFGGAVPGLSMEFGEFGGNLNIEINGDFRNFNNFQDINGAVIGGTFVTVPAGGFGNDQGELIVNGVINSFKIGGQELWIDHICQQEGQIDSLDWGDAPDGPNGPFYNTLAANNGAFHVIDDLIYLGSSVDPELDGQPTFAADGDDTNGAIPDDEDGVRFLTPVIPGQNTRVEVTANEDGYLNAWMDFNRSGTWDAGDQIYSSQFLTAGVHLLSFPVPASADTGTSYSRWRFVETGFPIGPAGSGLPDNAPLIGEVEDYRHEIERQDDPDCIDFEHLALGTEYFVGDMFNADPVGLSADFTGEPFIWSSGTAFAGGVAKVDNGMNAGHLGQDIAVNNILLDVDFGGAIPGLEMNFGEFGGNLNIEINGDFRNFNNFVDINGAVIGGTIVSVPAGGFGNDQGILVVDGNINSFKIGGQEFWMDHICLYEGQGGADLDWGDAPDSSAGPMYNTLVANNGARHFIDNVHFLGERVDPELDGQPNLSATGDDLAGPDEDGVRFLTPMIPGSPATVEVTAAADGFLSAWVDFNRNGQWDPSDQIASVDFLPAGSHILSFNVPTSAEPGTTYSRWRFTSRQVVLGPAGVGTPTGELIDGEVEDYLGRIIPDQGPNTDFDQDGDCDCDDIDALVANIASGSYDAAMDLDGNGTLDLADLDIWSADAGIKNGLPGPYLPGDANLDGVVDIGDFNIWNANKFTTNTGWCGGDWNADGATDISDFNIWNANKFTSSDSAAPRSAPVDVVRSIDFDSADREDKVARKSADALFALIGSDAADAWS